MTAVNRYGSHVFGVESLGPLSDADQELAHHREVAELKQDQGEQGQSRG
jgi:hypothetical protein